MSPAALEAACEALGDGIAKLKANVAGAPSDHPLRESTAARVVALTGALVCLERLIDGAGVTR